MPEPLMALTDEPTDVISLDVLDTPCPRMPTLMVSVSPGVTGT